MLRQGMTNAKEHKDGPLPSERIDRNAESEPPDQLQISEEIESSGGCELLDKAGHVDPAFHPERPGTSERVGEEH